MRYLLIITALATSAHAQLRVETVSSAESASGVRVQLSIAPALSAPPTLEEALAGEQMSTLRDGSLIAVRRYAVLLPSAGASVTVGLDGYRTFDLDAPTGDLGANERPDLPAGEWAWLTDTAPSGSRFAATLEVVVARYDAAARTLTVPVSMQLRVSHAPWPAGRTSGTLVTGRSAPEPSAQRTSVWQTSGMTRSRYAEGEWYRFDVTETGVYKLTRSWFRNAGVSETQLRAIAQLRVFGNGGRPVPEVLTASRPDGLAELTRKIIDRDGDGELDDDDYVVLYGRSVRDWSYDPVQKRYSHTVNPYTEKNAYFFTFDGDSAGRSMPGVPNAATASVVAQDVQGRIAVDEDKVNFVGSGRNWVGTSFDVTASSAVFVNTLHGIVPGTPVTYRTALYSRSATIDSFRVYEQDQLVGGPILMLTSDVNSVDQTFDYAYDAPVASFSYSGTLPDGRSVLKFVFGTRNQAAKGWLDWFEIFYRRSLTAVSDRLLFPGRDTTATIGYTVRGLSSRETIVLDVSDHGNVREITGLTFDPVDATVCTFRVQHAAGAPPEFAVVGQNGFLVPPDPKKVTPEDLRVQATPVTFIILSPPEFISEANRLRQHRETHDGIATRVVNIEDVFTGFGGGLPDPFAVRDYLAYARANYPGTLRYVLFLGCGHYDYRNIATSARNWIPPYETAESNYQIFSYTSDDYFVQLDPGNPRISLAIGRLPARSVADARSVVDKLIRYDTESPLDPWRNRITFIADDGQTSTNPFEGSLHTAQAENLAVGHTPNTFEKRKIYTVEYPTVISSSGRRKPAANRDIVSAFNEGSLIINFTGHGNPRLWTHEYIFTRESDLPQLRNRDRLPLLVAATCNYAQWDDPDEQSSGELLVTNPDAGTIAVVTATRSVYSNFNAQLNYDLYDNLFLPDSAGDPVRIGDAFWAMKQIRYDVNDRKYHLLGDPTTRLLRPKGSLTIDSVNGGSVRDSVVSVPTLGVLTVGGTVRQPDSTVAAGFSGTGLMELFDSKRIITVPEWGGYPYEKSGSVLYRGEISVTDGRFTARVPVPKDVTFGSRARLSLYALGASTDAVGTTEQIIIAGTDTSAAVDTTGPVITIRLQSQDFLPGGVVPPDPVLIVELNDQSGINTSTVGIGHRLEAVLSADQRVIDLSNDYKGNLDTYQSGTATRVLTGLPEGRQSVRVRAWDIHNNSSTSEVDFEVRTGAGADIFQVVNYPNPFSRSTWFTMQRISSTPVDIRIRIYTVAGRMIRELEAWSVTDRFVRIPWDGRDREGNEIANGVYLYKVIVKDVLGGETKEVIEKLAVVR